MSNEQKRLPRLCACGARITNLNPRAGKCTICYERLRDAAAAADDERYEDDRRAAGGRAPRYLDGRRVGDE